MGYRYTVMDASVSIHMLLDHQQMTGAQYDATVAAGAVSSNGVMTGGATSGSTLVAATLDGVPGVVEYTAPGFITYTPVAYCATGASANGASSSSINGQMALPSTAQPPPPPQTAYIATAMDPNSSGYFEPGIHYVMPSTTCSSSPTHQGDYIVTPSTPNSAEPYDPKAAAQQGNGF